MTAREKIATYEAQQAVTYLSHARDSYYYYQLYRRIVEHPSELAELVFSAALDGGFGVKGLNLKPHDPL